MEIKKLIHEVLLQDERRGTACLTHPLLSPEGARKISKAVGPTLEKDERAALCDLKAWATMQGDAGSVIDRALKLPSAKKAGTSPQIVEGTMANFSKILAANRGKVVLIDFWASWCGPCRHELPNVKAAREQFKADGLVVISISLDEDRKALEQTLKSEGIDWTQLYDGKSWQGEIAKRYNVQGIPHMLILGRDGTPVAEGDAIRGEALAGTLASALKR
jgi:thiol-disulfide isomerase/thioredoxin